ncbi:hypothetical protein KCU77_g92, partial [Aureobasidium melanogenum]
LTRNVCTWVVLSSSTIASLSSFAVAIAIAFGKASVSKGDTHVASSAIRLGCSQMANTVFRPSPFGKALKLACCVPRMILFFDERALVLGSIAYSLRGLERQVMSEELLCSLRRLSPSEWSSMKKRRATICLHLARSQRHRCCVAWVITIYKRLVNQRQTFSMPDQDIVKGW